MILGSGSWEWDTLLQTRSVSIARSEFRVWGPKSAGRPRGPPPCIVGRAPWKLPKLARAMILPLLLLSLPCRPALPSELGVLRSEDRWVEINHHGLLVKTPPGGVEALDGPSMPLRGQFAEWYGLSYRSSAGEWNGCAAGAHGDWSAREAIENLAFECDGAAATALDRLGALEIRTDFSFDSNGDLLIVEVEITNRGDTVAQDIVYTREVRDGQGTAKGWGWPEDLLRGRPAPPDLMRKAWMLDDLRPGASNGFMFSYAWPAAAGSGTGVDVPLEFWTNGVLAVGLRLQRIDRFDVGRLRRRRLAGPVQPDLGPLVPEPRGPRLGVRRQPAAVHAPAGARVIRLPGPTTTRTVCRTS